MVTQEIQEFQRGYIDWPQWWKTGSSLFAPVGHMPFDIAGVEFGSTKGTLFSWWQWGKGHTRWLHYYLQCKPHIWKFIYQSFFSCVFFASWIWFGVACLPHWGSAELHHAVNCVARQYLFCFNETMPLVTNHKFSLDSISKVNLPYQWNDFQSEMPC